MAEPISNDAWGDLNQLEIRLKLLEQLECHCSVWGLDAARDKIIIARKAMLNEFVNRWLK